LFGVAVNVTDAPAQIFIPGLAEIFTVGVTVGFTVTFTVPAALTQPLTVIFKE
jgi:hypothetical protein